MRSSVNRFAHLRRVAGNRHGPTPKSDFYGLLGRTRRPGQLPDLMAAEHPAHTLRDMGHLGHIKDEYRALVTRLEAGQVAMPEPRDPRAWQGWKDILEILYSPEEAELASRMPVRPTDIERLAATLAIPVAQLRPRLDAMC